MKEHDVMYSVESEFFEILESIPEEIREIQGIANIEPFALAEEYFKSNNIADVSIDPNANMSGKSPVNFQSELFKPQLKLRSYYELWKRLKSKYGNEEAKEILVSMLNGTIYFHDITKLDIPYCFAFDTSFLMIQGRPYGWLPGKPPKRSNSFIGQLVETTMDMSQEHAGAIGVANILVNLAYYTRKERAELHRIVDRFEDESSAILGIAMFLGGLGYSGTHFEVNIEGNLEDRISQYIQQGNTIHEAADLSYNKYVEDLLQQYVHVMHNTFRVGGDSPFTNISIFDKRTFFTVFESARYPDGTKTVDNYEEVKEIQRVYVEFFVKGSPVTGKKYRFPVSTVNLKMWGESDYKKGLCTQEQVGKLADYEFFEWITNMNLERGTFNFHIGEKVATCCRLTSDLAELKDKIRTDSFGNGGMSIGSHRVVAINLHRIALIHHYENKTTGLEFEVVLNKYLEQTKKLLIVHKELLSERVDAGFLKFFNIGWEDLNMFFSTFGYTGLWDAYEVTSRNNAAQHLDEYATWAESIIDYMEAYAKRSGKEHEGYAFNVEEIPGENACPKLAKMDNFYYSNSQGYYPREILSNQMIPLYVDVPLFDRLETAGKLMDKVSGGAILHLNINEAMTPAANREFHRMMVEDYKIPHYAINRGSTTCVNGHTTPGIHWECPECGGEIDTHTIRVVGFDTDTKDWAKERREWEWKEKGRQFYTARNLLNDLK